MALYFRLEDASGLIFSDTRSRVTTPEEYLGWQMDMIMMRRIARVWKSDERVPARVNHGRWLTDCQACYEGVLTHPEWKIACCGNCGAVYRDVIFPPDIAEITRILLERPKRETQNWEPGESIAKLKFENILHRLAS